MTHELPMMPDPGHGHRGRHYQILIAGHLDEQGAKRFDGLLCFHTEDGCTRLEGKIVDQSALHGVLKRIHSLGLTLISVNSYPSETNRTE